VLEGDYAILLVTETASEFLSAELSALYDSPKPVVTILPDARKRGGWPGNCSVSVWSAR
jgi:vacuolar-type H+-ATPase subunit F/Vma7